MIGNENLSLEANHDKWSQLISDVKSLFHGPLCYGLVTWTWRNALETAFSNDWLKELDYTGVNSYFHLTDKNDPSLDALKAAWSAPYYGNEKTPLSSSILQLLSDLNKFTGKPIVFSEVGYPSVRGANKLPADTGPIPDSDNAVDYQEQSDCYEAMFEVLQDQPWWKGFFIWAYPTDITLGGNSTTNQWWDNKSITPLNKPVENDVFRKWFST
jgi:hypothetical protein